MVRSRPQPKLEQRFAKPLPQSSTWAGAIRALDLTASTGVGIRFAGDVRDAAIRFEQPHERAQPLWWNVQNGRAPHTLTVDP
jgi:hypothetical protein